MKNKPKTTINIPLYLTVFYIFINITTAYYQFPILDSIGINKIMPVCILFLIILSSKSISTDKSSISFGKLLILLYVAMLCSHVFSEIEHSGLAQHWLETYWQQGFLFWFIYLSINEKRDAMLFVATLVVFMGIYQLLTWRDFLAGGSYVWQQGFKRMAGAWSGGGLGAANAWGFLSLFFFPLGYYLYLTAKNRKIKILTLGFLIISTLSVFFSGTRAALICLAVIILLITYKKIFQFKVLLLFVFVAVSIHMYLPNELKQRYLGSIYSTHSIDEAALSIAENSAESRLQGLIDGWKLFTINPFFGWGPGTSSEARTLINDEVRQIFIDEHHYLQLHNLYGQVMSELGMFGGGIFILLCILCIKKLRRIIRERDIDDEYKLDVLAMSLLFMLIATLIYGAASHNLYKIYWYIIFGLACGIFKVSIAKKEVSQAEMKTAGKKFRFNDDMNLNYSSMTNEPKHK